MKKVIALGVAAVGGVIAISFLPRNWRGRLSAAARRRMSNHMEKMMAGLSEGSPPKLVMSVLPKLQAQNERIITILQEQNELLREQQNRSASKAAA